MTFGTFTRTSSIFSTVCTSGMMDSKISSLAHPQLTLGLVWDSVGSTFHEQQQHAHAPHVCDLHGVRAQWTCHCKAHTTTSKCFTFRCTVREVEAVALSHQPALSLERRYWVGPTKWTLPPTPHSNTPVKKAPATQRGAVLDSQNCWRATDLQVPAHLRRPAPERQLLWHPG
eukprot:5505097-Amphidinium_carterae.1